MNMFCIESILARQEGRLYKAGFFDIGIQRLEILVTPKQGLAFLFQLGKSFQARSLLCLFTTGPTRASGLRGLPTFMGLKPAVTASPKVLSCQRGTMTAESWCISIPLSVSSRAPLPSQGGQIDPCQERNQAQGLRN